MNEVSFELKSKYQYHSIFGDICRIRFNHLLTKLLLILVIVEVLLVFILCNGGRNIFKGFFISLIKFIKLYLSLVIVMFTRKNYVHVQYFGYSNILTSFLGKLFSLRFLVYLLTYTISSILIANVYDGSFGISMWNWNSFEYQLYLWVLFPFFYTLQHVILDHDRLPFKFDVQYQSVRFYIQKRLKSMAIRALSNCFIVFVMSPILFWFVCPTVSNLLNLKLYLQLFLLSLVVAFNFELVNLLFNAYMLIGCLHKGKLISSLSPSPMETLISGLSSKKPFTKLTAFQELSYRAIASDESLRIPVYQTRVKNASIWPMILKELIIVIQNNNESVGKYLHTLHTGENTQFKMKSHNNNGHDLTLNQHEDKIFGNGTGFDQSSLFTVKQGFSNRINNGENQDTVIELKNSDILLHKINGRKQYSLPSVPKYFGDSTRAFDEPIITHKTKLMIAFQKLWDLIKNKINFTSKLTHKAEKEVQHMSFLEACDLSKIRVAERLVKIPVIQAYSIISLLGFYVNALDEDPKGSIVSSVGEALKILERSVGSLGKYASWKPDSQWNEPKEGQTDNITRLYELSVSAFLEIVLKYNILLYDIYLDDDVLTLSKWVLGMCDKENK
ncbi:hypothetical protein Kpol_1023p72 [Vanderwaltozyma polyspora DSM 70294]|uniref:Nucleoporin NDC1 n=1 Tax=Vanderwaltozyma polyspora (strain ATCC 22028 / DSM 70294 / BCRC 21397 / CBS 2163 / NBRC 10782 / NRRL Y-8283 / UCD 57-17) TaxID=436907 RepID=A7TFU5_VANPO|nr:uncharacterized protein Kpol_1023p72 [Vanderwaltozyma polyspora DSM 70294]EDO18903.1 hypothetical protein Kpol_1023p72 [Vanderwaltozyma polyspora DSM 70294]